MPRSASCFCVSVARRSATRCRCLLNSAAACRSCPIHLGQLRVDALQVVFLLLQATLLLVEADAVDDQLVDGPAILALQPAEELQAQLDLVEPFGVGLPALAEMSQRTGEVLHLGVHCLQPANHFLQARIERRPRLRLALQLAQPFDDRAVLVVQLGGSERGELLAGSGRGPAVRVRGSARRPRPAPGLPHPARRARSAAATVRAGAAVVRPTSVCCRRRSSRTRSASVTYFWRGASSRP